MVETLLNWLVMLASFAALAWVAFVGFRDLRSLGDARPVRTPRSAPPAPAPAWEEVEEETPALFPAEEETAARQLRVDYYKDGRLAHTQRVTDSRPGFVGAETVREMGPGTPLRLARLYADGEVFMLENRHGSRSLTWRDAGDNTGELPPGDVLPLHGEVDLLLGDWVVSCREEG